METIAIKSFKDKASKNEIDIVKFEVESAIKKDSKRVIAAKVGNFFLELGSDGKRELSLN